jgi:hypothetical protein
VRGMIRLVWSRARNVPVKQLFPTPPASRLFVSGGVLFAIHLVGVNYYLTLAQQCCTLYNRIHVSISISPTTDSPRSAQLQCLFSGEDPYLGAISSGECDGRERRELCP